MNKKTVRTYPCMKNAELNRACAEASSHTAKFNFRHHTCGEPFFETFDVVEVPFVKAKRTKREDLQKMVKADRDKAERINRTIFQAFDTGLRTKDLKRVFYYRSRQGQNVTAFQMFRLNSTTQKQLTA